MTEIKNIIERLKSGELCENNDESFADGLWDYTYELFPKYASKLGVNDYQDLVEIVYHAFYEIAEECLDKDLSGNNK